MPGLLFLGCSVLLFLPSSARRYSCVISEKLLAPLVPFSSAHRLKLHHYYGLIYHPAHFFSPFTKFHFGCSALPQLSLPASVQAPQGMQFFGLFVSPEVMLAQQTCWTNYKRPRAAGPPQKVPYPGCCYFLVSSNRSLNISPSVTLSTAGLSAKPLLSG